MTLRSLVLAAAVATALLGCAGKKPLVPADQLWTEANEAYADEAYDYAIQKYKALLDQYPFDPHAEEAELKIGQAYYEAERYPEAIAAFGNFERMHPTSSFLPTTEYHRGLAYLAQYTTADRDQQAVKNALNTFRNIIDRFPGTPWADRSQLRLRECREALARHEGEVANYYLATNPASHFRSTLMVARPMPGRRYGLANNQLTVHHLEGPSERRMLKSVGEVREVLESVFGLTLPPPGELDAALARACGFPG